MLFLLMNHLFSNTNQEIGLQLQLPVLISNLSLIFYLHSIISLQRKMQSSNDFKHKLLPLFVALVSKISRLRKRLISCGYSIKEVADIIFVQFLQLPEIEWSSLEQTHSFYDIKNSFKVDNQSAEIIMRLQKAVPNLQTAQVCQYLLTILEVNAGHFGINLQQSSSDSSESNSGVQKLKIRRSNRRLKRNNRKDDGEKKRSYMEEEVKKKKVHHDISYSKKKLAEEQINHFFKSRPFTSFIPCQEQQLEKQMKKIPESSDSDHE